MAAFCGALLDVPWAVCEMLLQGNEKSGWILTEKSYEYDFSNMIFLYLQQWEYVLVVILCDCCGGVTFKTWVVAYNYCCKL